MFTETSDPVSSQDWEFAPLPLSARLSLQRVTATWAGFVFVPLFIDFAFSLASNMPRSRFIISVMLGGLILGGCSAVTGVIAQKTGLTSGLLLRSVFGSHAGRFVALIPGVCLIGWNSFSLDLAGTVVADSFGMQEHRGLIIFILMVPFAATAALGIRLISRMSLITVPLMSTLLLVGLFLALRQPVASEPAETSSVSLASAVTQVVGLFALGAALCSPDIQRFCRTTTSAVVTAFVTFGIAFPFLLITGGITATISGAPSMMESFQVIGFGGLGLLTFLLLTWTTCDNDYYSASLGWAAVTGVPKKWLVLPLGLVAASIATISIGSLLQPWLILMTTIAVPLAGVFLAETMAHEGFSASVRPIQIEAFIAWVAGSGASYFSTQFQIGLPPLQGIIVAFVVHVILRKVFKQS